MLDEYSLGDTEDLSGRKIGGFEILEKIGRGANSTVYKARQMSMDRIVAFKVVPGAGPAAVPLDAIERFLREAKISAKLSHPNIVHGIDAGEEGGLFYFAAEYVDGRDIERIISEKGTLGELEALGIIRQVTLGLQHAAEAGIVHRDVKPANIIVTPKGTAKLVDLGLARPLGAEQARVTQAGTVVGTPYYLSPEQARGETYVDVRSDIYSLGATLFHMLTGDVPFEAPTAMMVMAKRLTEKPPSAKKVNPEVSEQTDHLIKKMMATKKEQRHSSYQELIRDIDGLIRVAKTRSAATAPRPAKPAARALLPDEDSMNLYDSRVQKIGVLPPTGPAEGAAARRPAAPPHGEQKVPAAPRKLRKQEPTGGWTVPSTEPEKTSHLELQEVLDMIAREEITRYTTIAGPTTNYMLAAAEDTPMISKYLGICFHCKKFVSSADTTCPNCKCDLDRPLSSTFEEPEAAKSLKRQRRVKYALTAAFLLFFIWTCTNLWTPFVSRSIETHLMAARSFLWQKVASAFTFLRDQVRVIVDPDEAALLAEWRAEIERARAAFEDGDYETARAAYGRAVALAPNLELDEEDAWRYREARRKTPEEDSRRDSP